MAFVPDEKGFVPDEAQATGPKRSPVRLARPGLPGFEETESIIEKRTSVLDDFLERKQRLQEGPESFMSGAKDVGMAVLDAVYLPTERGSAALSNVLMEVQKDEPKLLNRSVDAVLSGLQGSRLGNMSDPVRNILPDDMSIGGIDVREGISQLYGFGAELGLTMSSVSSISNMFGKNKIQAAKDVEKHYQKLTAIKKQLGTKVRDVMTKKVGSKGMNPVDYKQVVDAVPDDVMSTILKDPKKYGVTEQIVKKTRTRQVGFGKPTTSTTTQRLNVPENTASNMWQFRQALDDIAGSETFKGAGSMPAKAVKHASDIARDGLSRIDKAIAPVMEKYSQFTDKFGKVKDLLVDSKGRVKTNAVASVLKGTGEGGKALALQRLGEVYNGAGQLTKSLALLNRRRDLVAGARGLAKVMAGTAIAGTTLAKYLRGNNQE